jgi:hypothetical protein
VETSSIGKDMVKEDYVAAITFKCRVKYHELNVRNITREKVCHKPAVICNRCGTQIFGYPYRISYDCGDLIFCDLCFSVRHIYSDEEFDKAFARSYLRDL